MSYHGEPGMKKVFVDVEDKQLKGLSLGDEITITTTGKICELRHREDYEAMPCGCMGAMKTGKGKDAPMKKEMKKMPSTVGVKVSSIKLNGKNAYEELDKDSED